MPTLTIIYTTAEEEREEDIRIPLGYLGRMGDPRHLGVTQ